MFTKLHINATEMSVHAVTWLKWTAHLQFDIKLWKCYDYDKNSEILIVD